jgi:hypothetical protein
MRSPIVARRSLKNETDRLGRNGALVTCRTPRYLGQLSISRRTSMVINSERPTDRSTLNKKEKIKKVRWLRGVSAIPCSACQTTRPFRFALRPASHNFPTLCDEGDCGRCLQNLLKIAGKCAADSRGAIASNTLSNSANLFSARVRFMLDRDVCLTYICSMKRVSMFLSDSQIAALKKLARRTGIKMSELIRRFIDEGLKRV